MKLQNKRILKATFGLISVSFLLVFFGETFESYIKSLFYEDKIITLILIIPFALYLFNKVEVHIDKNATQSSDSKELLKGLKDYGQKNGIMANVISVKQIL